MSSASHYQYSPLPSKDCIRLLTLNKAENPNAPIILSLEAHRLDNTIRHYTALSYSWGRNRDGDATLSHRINIDNAVLAITENLFDGLRRLRDAHDHDLLLWIDAVCINQTDIPERNTQVSMMADIYSRASALAIWLGEGDEKEDRIALQMLQRAQNPRKGMGSLEPLINDATFLGLLWPSWVPTHRSKDAKVINDANTSSELMTDLALDFLEEFSGMYYWESDINYIHPDLQRRLAEIADGRLRVMLSLLDRRYFQRRWIVQEVSQLRVKTTATAM